MATSNSGSSRAALRRQQEADERARRSRRILVAGIGIAVIVVIAVVAVVLSQTLGRSSATGEQLTPPNASGSHGIYVQGKAPVDGTPHVVVWGDYQCPGCAANEEVYGPVIEELVAAGDITAEARQAHFRDQQATRGPSKRASIAAAAADEVGFFDAYHRTLYQNQDSGYTDQALRELVPASVGMEGKALTRFQELYDTLAYEAWVDAADQRFRDDGVESTPSYFVGDQQLMLFDYEAQDVLVEPTADAFLSAVKALA